MPPSPSVERTHQELLQLLVLAQHLSGKTGVRAEELAKNLEPHLEREDECALPLLGLLQTLATGKVTLAEARRASKLYSRLRRQYSSLSPEHKELAKLIEKLKRVASEEGHLTAVRFAETLERHSQDEEELLYPATLHRWKNSFRGYNVSIPEPRSVVRTPIGTVQLTRLDALSLFISRHEDCHQDADRNDHESEGVVVEGNTQDVRGRRAGSADSCRGKELVHNEVDGYSNSHQPHS